MYLGTMVLVQLHLFKNLKYYPQKFEVHDEIQKRHHANRSTAVGELSCIDARMRLVNRPHSEIIAA